MKVTRLLFATLACIAALASCGPEPDPTPDNGEGKENEGGKEKDPEQTPKSKECKLTAFIVTVGTDKINAFIDPVDKTIELSYFPYQFNDLKSAVAEVVISDKAKIAPDPSQPIDYTVEGGIEFTVTAEDDSTTTKYTTLLALAEVKESCKKVWEKTYGQLGLSPTASNMCGVGFVDREHFATADFNVYDLTGAKVGTLNKEGIPGFDGYSGQLGAMSNDENGILVAFAEYKSSAATTSEGILTEAWAWLDGWSAAPTKIYGPFDYPCNYMSVSGDIKKDFILTFRTGAAVRQMHHVVVFKDGIFWKEDPKNPGNMISAGMWHGPFIEHPGNDGCWGQLLSFFSGDPEDGFVCWDSLGPAEYDDYDRDPDTGEYVLENGNKKGNATTALYVYAEGLSAYVMGLATEEPLYGNVHWGAPYTVEGKRFHYGNFSTGHARAFIYNGQKSVIVCSGSWPNTWITIQKATNLVEDDEATDEVDESEANYYLSTDIIPATAQCYPCCAYVYDPATLTGHVIYLSQSLVAAAYDILTEIL